MIVTMGMKGLLHYVTFGDETFARRLIPCITMHDKGDTRRGGEMYLIHVFGLSPA